MKKIIVLLVTAVLIFYSASCTKYYDNEISERDREIADRIIIGSIGITGDDFGRTIADINNIEAITELSTQIILCHIDKLEEAYMTELNVLRFIYEITIEEIYMDVNDMLKIGDSVRLSTAKGIMKGNEFTKLAGNSAHAQKFGYANREYEDNEYIVSSSYEGIPVEIGKSYIMYLTDEFLKSDGLYAETGREFIYEYTNDTVYKGLDYQKMDISITQLKEQILGNIKNRTGRADEIGYGNYIAELGKSQREK